MYHIDDDKKAKSPYANAAQGDFCVKTKFQRGLNTLDFDVAAKHVRIRVGRFAEVVFIVRTHGEKSGINFRQNAGKTHRFISAEVDLDRHSLR